MYYIILQRFQVRNLNISIVFLTDYIDRNLLNILIIIFPLLRRHRLPTKISNLLFLLNLIKDFWLMIDEDVNFFKFIFKC